MQILVMQILIMQILVMQVLALLAGTRLLGRLASNPRLGLGGLAVGWKRSSHRAS
jgi:hypothetical protein